MKKSDFYVSGIDTVDRANIREYRDTYEYREACEYAVGDRVQWVQVKGHDAPATVLDVSPDRARIKIRFDQKQRAFDSLEVWIDRQAIEPKE